MLPSAAHTTDMEHIKPEAKNDTLTTGCPATKSLTIAFGAEMPVLVHGKRGVYGKLRETLRLRNQGRVRFSIHMRRHGCMLEIGRFNTCSKSLLFYTDTDLNEVSVHSV